MTYSLEFKKSALKEWKKLNSTVREQLKKKLVERLKEPRVRSAKLSGADDAYKIKLKQLGYRLVYTVYDDKLIVEVVAIGKREKNKIYDIALSRLKD